MGIIDDLTSTLNKGAAAAERGAKTVKLKANVSELNKKRQQLAAQLGASLYEATKDVEDFRQGRESLYDEIASCDAERDECLRLIEELENQAASQAASSASHACAVCGTNVGASCLFCSGCGAPKEKALGNEAKQAAEDAPRKPVCASCGSSMNEGDAFCMSCGAQAAVPSPEGESDPLASDGSDASTEIESSQA